MSYCVNCGVELEPAAARCPLCDTPVANPREPVRPEEARYAEELARAERALDLRFALLLITALLALPALVCAAIDLLYGPKVSWSLFVAGASGLVWCFVVPPFLLGKRRIAWTVAIDLAAAAALLWFVALRTDGRDWFFPLALPLLVIAALGAAVIFLTVKKLLTSKLYSGAAIFVTLGAALVALEAVADNYRAGAVRLQWSLVALVPCFAAALVLVLIKRHRRMREELERRLHF